MFTLHRRQKLKKRQTLFFIFRTVSLHSSKPTGALCSLPRCAKYAPPPSRQLVQQAAMHITYYSQFSLPSPSIGKLVIHVRGRRPSNGRPGLRMAVRLQVKVRGRGLGLYARSVCDTKSPLQLLVALCKCYMPLSLARRAVIRHFSNPRPVCNWTSLTLTPYTAAGQK